MRIALVASVVVLTAGFSASAQEPLTEKRVPVDLAGTTTEITPELERRLGLFPDVVHFVSAQLFQAADSSYVLEVTFRTDGQLGRRRSVLSAAEVEAFRQDVTRRLRTLAPEVLLNQEGRGGLIFRQTLLSVGFYGWAVPVSVRVSDARAAVATYMIVSGSGFLVPYFLTRNVPVTHAHRMVSAYGSSRGVAYGLLLEDALFREEDDSARRALGFATVGSMAGAFLGFEVADRMGLGEGQAELIGVMGDFGLAYGAGVATVLGLYDESSRRRWADAVVLAAGGLGFGGGSWLAARTGYSRGDAYALRGAGLLGAHLALPVVNSTGTEDDKVYALGLVVGSAAGLAVGDRLLRDRDLSFSAGLITASGQIAGGLLALGATYLLDRGGEFDELAYLTTSALGSFAGFALTLRAVTRKGRERAPARQGMNIDLVPEGVAIAALRAREGVEWNPPAPVLRVRF